ncbi:MAG: hypothetical protein AAFX03_01575 [Pseudomonadota bacterium]
MIVRRLTAAISVAFVAGCGGEPGDAAPRADGAPSSLSRAASLAAACSGCHAATNESIARLDDLSAEAIAAALAEYKADAVGTSVMHRLARGYADADIALIAEYLGAEEP